MNSLKRPLVLVHGLWDSPQIFKHFLTYLGEDSELIYAPHLPHKGGRRLLRDLAYDFDQLIFERFPRDTSFDLLGFSMGGIIGRIWLQEMKGSLRTKHFLSVGSPQKGTLLSQLVPSWLLGGVADMKCGSKLLQDLNSDITSLERVKCTSFFCKWDLMVFPGWEATLPIGKNFSVPVLTHKDLILNSISLDLIIKSLLAC